MNPRLRLRTAGSAVRRHRRAASTASLTLVASTLVVLAVRAEGTPVTDVDLNDGGVWVTNAGQTLLARYNKQIEELDLGVVSSAGSFDVLQSGQDVVLDALPWSPEAVLHDGSTQELRTVNVALGELGNPVGVPATAEVAYGSGTVAIADTATGKVWVRRSGETLGAFSEEDEPDLDLGKGVRVVVDPHGVVTAVGKNGAVRHGVIGADGVFAPTESEKLKTGVDKKGQLTSVAGRAVVLTEDGELLTDGAETTIGEGAALVQPTTGAELYVATPTGLLAGAPGGDLDEIKPSKVDGPPARPVVVGDCVHAAWADTGDGAYLKWCGDDSALEMGIPKVTSASVLEFRTNRKAVVLNDAGTGDTWLQRSDQLIKVPSEQWNAVDPRIKQQELQKKQVVEQDKDEHNEPPKPKDDTVLGARAGQATVLPVTSNDGDADGDILTITRIEPISGIDATALQKVGQDTAVQVQVPPAAKGAIQFRYYVTDGHPGEPVAAVATVPITQGNDNAAPKPVPWLPGGPDPITVLTGKQTSTYVLPAWFDPDGDELSITSASAPAGAGEVSFTAQGRLTFRDSGQGVGTKSIDLTLSDGHGGELRAGQPVQVLGQPSPPVLVPDRVVGKVGTELVVEPLDNDRSTDGSALLLRSVASAPGLEVRTGPQSFTVVPRTAGTTYLRYKANSDFGVSESFVRIDVLPQTNRNTAPVAVRDQAVLPTSGAALVDLVGNDFDAEDDVLVVRGVTAPPGIKASLVGKRMLRVEATRPLTGTTTVTYDISDGLASSTGSVSVGQMPPTAVNRPPVAVGDVVRLRADAIGSVAVLANDSDPDGDELQLEDASPPESKPDMIVSLAGRQLRVRAPHEPGDYPVSYTVRDPEGRRATEVARIRVLPDTAEDNNAPDPAPVTGRAIAEQRVRVPLRMVGADPDGDLVSFKGVRKAPSLGRIVATGLDWIAYESFPGRVGTDTFQLVVQDRYGATGVVDVRLGVVPPIEGNQPPVAMDDSLVIRPGRTLDYDVLRNDVDADGDALKLGDQLEGSDGAKVVGDFLRMTAPDADGGAPKRAQATYEITDGKGGTARATFTLTGDPKAPLYAPITRDDAAELAEIAGKSPGDSVTVDVLKNDGDLDGPRGALRVHAVDGDVSSVVGSKLRIVLKRGDQVVAYRVTDGDDRVSYGFVFVSGTETVPPVLDPEVKLPVKVKAGLVTPLALGDYVKVRKGRTPRLTSVDRITVPVSDGGTPFKDIHTLQFRAEPDYAGKASISFEVTDGKDLDDPTRLDSMLTIPIDVLPAHNIAPTLRGTSLEVPVDEGDARVDLAELASDVNAEDIDDLSFAVSGGVGKLKASIEDGSELVVKADGAAVGDTVVLTTEVTDSGGKKAKARVDVRVVGSTKPLVSVPLIEVEGKPDQTTIADIGGRAFNPFDGKKLVLTDPQVEGGAGMARVEVAGETLKITPTKAAAGVMTVKYTVNDYLGDIERAVTGRVNVTVADVPDAPGRPNVSGVASKTAILSWGEPDDNGSSITSYIVEGSNGYKHECGASTTCTLSDLTNGDHYTFQVRAVNGEGPGELSPPSASAAPDELPQVMSAPGVVPTKQDGELELTWSAPVNEGSDITKYEIRMNGSGALHTVNGSEHSHTWTGLSNYEQSQFQIVAINDAEGKQEYSALSDAVNPYGKPLVDTAPTGATVGDGQLGGAVTVSWDWDQQQDNGNAVTGFRVRVYKDGGLAQDVTEPGSARSRQFEVENGKNYAFTIAGINAAGEGPASPQSTPVAPYGKATAPGAPTKVSEGDHTARLSWTQPDLRGGVFDHYELQSSAGNPGTQTTTSTTKDFAFSANNGPYTVQIRAVTKAPLKGTVTYGDWATVTNVRPYGQPFAPSVTSSRGDLKVTFNVQKPAPNGRAVTQLFVNGSPHAEGSFDVGTTEGGQQRCIDVYVKDEVGQSSSTVHHCNSSNDKRVWITAGSVISPHPSGCNDTCRYLVVNISGFAPGNHTATMHPTPWCGSSNCPQTIVADGNGNGSKGGFWFKQDGYLKSAYADVDGLASPQAGF